MEQPPGLEKAELWKNRFLFKAGKEILIKIVIQAIPNRVMSLFLLSKGTCKDLEKMFADF
uniref:Uncharacterized protein n=1 Tax=Manihot esculenta TaxID=3983 RepID=A0A2C9WKX0_MANES